MLETNNIIIIVPTHNRPELFDNCINNISPIVNHDNFKLLLVLDGCTEETWKIAKKMGSPNITIYEGDGNLFWGGAMAVGMSQAFNHLNARAVLWLNDDSIFKAQDILEIARAHQKFPNAIIGGKLVARNLENFPIYPETNIIESGFYKVPFLNGNFTLIPHSVYKAIGNIEPSLFPHFADAPYLEKARRNGFECLVVQDIIIGIHYDVLRHLPLYLQALCFKGTYIQFWKLQLLSKTSKWFLPYRWYYTKAKFKGTALFAFIFIFLRDFLPLLLSAPMGFLLSSHRARLVFWLSKWLLGLPMVKIKELEKEIAYMSS